MGGVGLHPSGDDTARNPSIRELRDGLVQQFAAMDYNEDTPALAGRAAGDLYEDFGLTAAGWEDEDGGMMASGIRVAQLGDAPLLVIA
jgi:hypothetical protein